MLKLQISVVFIVGTNLLKSGTALIEVKTLSNQISHYTKDFFSYCHHSIQKWDFFRSITPLRDLKMPFLGGRFLCLTGISINWKMRKITYFYLYILKC